MIQIMFWIIFALSDLLALIVSGFQARAEWAAPAKFVEPGDQAFIR
jgi:hypothetical protein